MAGGRSRSPRALADLELLAELRGVALGIHPQQLLVGDGELVHQDGRLAAQAGLQDGVVDEDVLLLQGARGHSVSGSRRWQTAESADSDANIRKRAISKLCGREAPLL